jgi:hypothetical protein
MAKFYGKVGYLTGYDEPEIGIQEPVFTEHASFGDIIRKSRNLVNSTDTPNTDIKLNHQISILMDAYVQDHYTEIRYVRWNNVAWTVTSLEVKEHRLILEVGSRWNGYSGSSASDTGQYTGD